MKKKKEEQGNRGDAHAPPKKICCQKMEAEENPFFFELKPPNLASDEVDHDNVVGLQKRKPEEGQICQQREEKHITPCNFVAF